MENTQNILFVIDSYSNPNAGTEGQLFQLIKHLDRKLYSPRLLVFKPSPWLEANNFPCDVDILGATSLKSPRTWYKLYIAAKTYRNQGLKLAHIYFNDASVMCPPIFKSVGIKTLISRRDMGYWYNRMYRFLLPLTGKCVEGVIVNSKAVGEITAKVERIPSKKVFVIYNGYEHLSNNNSEIEQLKNFTNKHLILGIVANVRPIKRMQDAIEALTKLNRQDVRLVIIGGGDASSLQAIAETNNISDKVLFLGARTDIRACLDYIDIGLLCSESEGFSNAIVEYQFAGLPVICSAVGGNPEAVRHGETGFLYPAGKVELLHKYLDKLVNDDELRRLFGQQAHDHACKNYSIERMISKHQSLYESITRVLT